MNWKPYVELVYVGQLLVGDTGVTVGSTPPTRTMRGDPHSARSFVEYPVARIVRINLTLCPAKGLKSTFAL